MSDKITENISEHIKDAESPVDVESQAEAISIVSESGDEEFVDASDIHLETEESNNDTVIHSPYNEAEVESNNSVSDKILDSLHEDEENEDIEENADIASVNEPEENKENDENADIASVNEPEENKENDENADIASVNEPTEIQLNSSEEEQEEPVTPEVLTEAQEEPIEQTNIDDEEETQPEEAFRYEEDATPEEISKSKNIKSTLAFLKKSFEEFQESKDFKNLTSPSKSLNKSLTDAIEDIDKILKYPANTIASINSILIFEALRNCCRCRINTGKIMALDGLSKLFAFQLLDEEAMVNPPDALSVNEPNNENTDITPPPKQKLMDAAIDTITDCFEGESTNENVELQIIRCLTSLILMEDTLNICHGQSLLKAIRTIYNIFIFSLNSSTQTIAQATLIQVVEKVFQRVRVFAESDNNTINEEGELTSFKSDASVASVNSKFVAEDGPLNLNDMKKLNDEEEANIDLNSISEESITEEQLSIKDAFLVFRSMAKISVKNIEDTLDMRSHAVRSKLLSLHMLHSILRDQVSLFLNPKLKLYSNGDKSLLDSIRQYLCLSVSRNATSPIAPVFEITLEILWIMVNDMRFYFKREIPIFFAEIYLPIAELKTSTNYQKKYFLQFLAKMSSDPSIIIEFYLNYDCDERFPNLTEIVVDFLSSNTLNKVENVSDSDKRQYIDSIKGAISTYDLSQLPLLSISNLSGGSVSNATSLSESNPLYMLSSNTTKEKNTTSSGSKHKSSASLSGSKIPLSSPNFPIAYHLKLDSLKCIILILRSLSTWCNINTSIRSNIKTGDENLDITISRKTSVSSASLGKDDNDSIGYIRSRSGSDLKLTSTEDDNDIQHFEASKIRKTELSRLLILFNKKPKKAIPELITSGFVKDDTPESIARFLLSTEGLDLTTVGDYLGEGDEKNIATMHALVDQLNFKDAGFIDALRDFLKNFKLPGESQKIDRFMLKFAERYVEQNPTVFAKPDTAYVLAFSLIMLNTDLHSPQIKKKITLEEFIDLLGGLKKEDELSNEYMTELYQEIRDNEIKLPKDASEESNNTTEAASNSAFNFFNMRDLNRETYMQVSKEITSKTEDVVKNLTNETEEDTLFHFANSKEHGILVFQNLWMSFLAGFTTSLNEIDYDTYPINLCLEGLQHGVRISATSRIDMAKNAFIGALIQFTNMSNIAEMKPKNVLAIHKLLEVVLQVGDDLTDSWKDVLFAVSQIERLQLIAKGVDGLSVPDVSSSRLKNVNSRRTSKDSVRSATVDPSITDDSSSFFGFWQTKKPNPIEEAQDKHSKQVLNSEISKILSSDDISVKIDMIFSQSSDLNAHSVIDFIKALTEVSQKEIESSQDSSQPRMFALQKMVDVCYYNMERIRVEWKPMWEVMGEAFINIASNSNKNLAVVFFAIDSLRQLSMRFLNLDELHGFEFQCDFLKPFKFIIQNSSSNYEIQQMCLECFNQFIVAKGDLLKSGWKPIFESLQYLAVNTIMDKISFTVLNTANLILKSKILMEHVFKQVSSKTNEQDDNYLQFIYVYRNMCKNSKFPKNSLKSLESLKKIRKYIFKDVNVAQGSKVKLDEEEFNKLWYPLLFTYHDIIMSSKDMEVRSMALTEMFECLVGYGSLFTVPIWTKICRLLIFPIFAVLTMHWDFDQFSSHEEVNVWLSTTLIQALRNSIALLTHYFESLVTLLPGFLDLLVSCICQENDTIARIGRSCLQQLIIENINKFTEADWVIIVDHFEKLFDLTTATELFESDPLKKGRRQSILGQQTVPKIELDEKKDLNFDEIAKETRETVDFSSNRAEEEESDDKMIRKVSQSGAQIAPKEVLQSNTGTIKNDLIRKRLSVKNTIVVKCVLQLMIIELLSELFDNEQFRNNEKITTEQMLRIVGMLEKSYTFSRDFNDDIGLRTRLVEAEVVDKIPNLLKQESSSAAVLVAVIFKLYFQTEDDKKNNVKLMDKAMEYCVDIIQRYVSFDENKMEKSIMTMRPVVIEILQGIYEFDDEDFKANSNKLYNLVLQILDKNLSNVTLRACVKQFFERIGDLYFPTH